MYYPKMASTTLGFELGDFRLQFSPKSVRLCFLKIIFRHEKHLFFARDFFFVQGMVVYYPKLASTTLGFELSGFRLQLSVKK